MNLQIWSDVAVAVQTLLGGVKAVTGITKATEAVVACVGHGFTAGAPVMIRCTGLPDADYLVGVVDASPTTDEFTLKDINSTNWRGTFVSGTAQLITFGAEFDTLQTVSPSGGEAADVLVSTIHTSQDKSIPGNTSPIVFAFDSIRDPADPGLKECRDASRTRTTRAIRFTFADGQKVYFVARPSTTLAPGGSAGAPVTTPLKMNVAGPLTDYAS